jgi:MFS family permease
MSGKDGRWRALAAATLGFVLDAMDVVLYLFALPAIRSEFGLTNARAGLAMAATMAASALGGIGAGILADRIGRRRTLMLTILAYSFGSAGSATSTGLASLLCWRAVVGLGLGGEWSSGAVLVAESWSAKHRAKAIGVMQSGFAVGYMLAAALSALVLPRWGWRTLFWIGLAPALLTLWIRRGVDEPEVWLNRGETAPFRRIFQPPLLRRTVVAATVAASVLFGYWGLFSWIPAFLSSPAAGGGAGLSLFATTGWVVAVQLGSLAGYTSFGFLADRIGRRPAFCLYVLGAAAVIPWFGLQPALALGPLVGFFGTGYFSLFGAMLAELYPTASRGAGQGFAYNFGRALAAVAPYTIGRVADARGLGGALVLNSGFFLAAAALVWLLPETKGRKLESV